MGDKKVSKNRRGFAAMDPEKQRAIARKGGGSVPLELRAFSRNPKLAKEAGRKGGLSVVNRQTFATNRALACSAGQKGGLASAAKRRAALRYGSE